MQMLQAAPLTPQLSRVVPETHTPLAVQHPTQLLALQVPEPHADASKMVEMNSATPTREQRICESSHVHLCW